VEVQFDLAAVLGAGASLTVVVGGFAGAGMWFKRWVRQSVAEPVQAAAKQLETSNGTTVAGYVERLTKDMAAMREDLTHRADTNRDLAMSALTLARSGHERLDAHLAGHKEG
jgi:hypothetical protein